MAEADEALRQLINVVLDAAAVGVEEVARHEDAVLPLLPLRRQPRLLPLRHRRLILLRERWLLLVPRLLIRRSWRRGLHAECRRRGVCAASSLSPPARQNGDATVCSQVPPHCTLIRGALEMRTTPQMERTMRRLVLLRGGCIRNLEIR